MQSTLLSTIISRMDRWQSASETEEQYKVRDLDEALRTLRREFQPPWALKKGSLKVFPDVLEYPVASDHDELAYLEDSTAIGFSQKARFWYTSLQQFYEDVNNRNQLAEIWDQGTKYLGVRFKNIKNSSVLLNNAETVGDWSVSGDADSVAKDTVTYKEGNASMKVIVTNSTDTATISSTLTSAINDSNYRKKYYFVWVYLDAAPTSISLRFGTSSSNYLLSSVTTQFSGQAFKADGWNLLGMNLDEATEVGTLDSTSLNYQAIILSEAASGTYFVDASYLREWELLDYWYYTTRNVMLTGSSIADQDYFYNSSETYETSTSLVGDDEWVDVIMYDALATTIGNRENDKVMGQILSKRESAWDKLMENYPSMKPLITTTRLRFASHGNNICEDSLY